MGRIPTGVEYNHSVRSGQVYSQSSRASWYKEQPRSRIGGPVEYFAPPASIFSRCLTVQAKVIQTQGPASSMIIQCVQRCIVLGLIVYSSKELLD